MDRPPWITSLHIRQFACIKDASFAFKPLTALIGPNDSGKSMVLRALRMLSVVAGPGARGDRYSETALQLAVQSEAVLKISCGGSRFWQIQVKRDDTFDELTTIDAAGASESFQNRLVSMGSTAQWRGRQAISGSRLLRLDPDAIRQPSGLIAPGEPVALLDERGTGLAGVLDALRDRADGSFEEIADHLCSLFPSIRRLQLKRISKGEKALQVELHDGTTVPPELVSEGILYFLAFKVVAKATAAPLLLVEEPENGLHPARIADVMKVLRSISETTQVILATHSPLVINELQGDEVIVLTRDADAGTQARLLHETFNFNERSKVYQNGELWLSYCNGTDERALLKPPEKQE